MPVAKVAADVVGVVGVPLYVDGRASTGVVSYRWEILGPEPGNPSADPGTVTVNLADEAIAAVMATGTGTWVLRLTVTNAAGESDSALTLVSIVSPSVTVTAPSEVSRWNAFTAKATVRPELEGGDWTWTTSPSEKVKITPSSDGTAAVVVPRVLGPVEVTASVSAPVAPTPIAGSTTVTVTEPPLGETGEAAYWQEKFLADNRAALTTVRASAATWQGMLTGVLGLFGTVTLLGAPSALDEVGSPRMAYLAVGMIVAAFLAAVTAVMVVTRIITPGVQLGGTPDPAMWGHHVLRAASHATERLRRSKLLAFSAASMIAIAGLVLALARLGGGTATADAPLALVRTSTATLCGPMTVEQGTGVLAVAGQEVGVARSVEVVESCAAPETSDVVAGAASSPYLLGLVVAAGLVGWILAVADSRGTPWRASLVGATVAFALAWGMSGEFFSNVHLLAVVVAVIVARWTQASLRPAPAAGDRGAATPAGQGRKISLPNDARG
ncbi:hypothetical protein [Ornithinimicrobium sp. CNJ-824]|uniref:hypothetical protein n=1 Tax=Ornithinimicrobium sp. CNJ-824 TaxID=1904966 RepID=UPI00117CE9C3|nr:hypothetical protein [Ornithinimicrobium sp. CNJ-824]